MIAFIRVLSGLALAGALAMPALAAPPQQGDSIQNGSMLIVWPDGTVARVHILESSAVDSAMQQATETNAPTMLIVQGGHTYLVPDRQMGNGKMMSDEMSDTSTPGITRDTSSSGSSSSSGTSPSGTTKQ